ncbi:hypothetical protein ZHAS_00005566 [Anopheles sinensis]|uniref:Uncharacterized protein n=1 Tax=Anopheles sinensis TaxID=74873 RepID=A0A084VJV3_ANOSI|nr:hypothetical protein ZHAS_00005566 [Anopheles sinensis]
MAGAEIAVGINKHPLFRAGPKRGLNFILEDPLLHCPVRIRDTGFFCYGQERTRKPRDFADENVILVQ